ncbi:hypothetical protein GCM10010140_30220 [Streptosporangium pseudovulgare]|uniref:Uncharacterized protein n=1 Tax=Streptosporangium pseudovulgare TaxID=35765 RepID=A0ABQ2QY18_9ACTN|nr:hypothetical protein GCM10010140_30220 [Streptosporangium pseudovulgare]
MGVHRSQRLPVRGRATPPQEFHGPQKVTHGAERGRMNDVLSALIPPVVVGGAFIYGVVKLLRSEAAGRRPAKREDVPGPQDG